MIKEKYTQLLLSPQMGGITSIDDTHKLAAMLITNRDNYGE